MSARIVWLLLCASAALSAQGTIQGTPESRAAHYYADGLERPLLRIRAGARLIATCDSMPRACSDRQRKMSHEHSVLTLLDALTLFPQRLPEDAASAPERPRDLKRRLGETYAALMREAGEYDRKLFARYGAALEACPAPEDQTATYRAQLDELLHIDLAGFQALDTEEGARALLAVNQEQAVQAVRLRALPVEDCAAIRRLGEYLMQLMHPKLRHWAHEARPATPEPRDFDFNHPKRNPAPKPLSPEEDRLLAHAVAGNFVTVVATELQLTAFPESEPRIKHITEMLERAKPAQ
jgi:hypothetical protein